jgi:hypothetical protein
MEKSTDTVTITKKVYDKLLHDSHVLSLLYAGGVDNWEWYSESLSELYDDEEDD